VSIYKKIKAISDKINIRLKETQLALYSAKSAYYVIFSAVPFMVLLVILLRVIFHEQVEYLIYTLLNAIPLEITGNLPDEFIDSVLGPRAGLIPITVILILWPASRGVGAITAGLRSIYGRKQEKNALKRHATSLFHTVIFLVVLILTMSLLVFGNVIRDMLTSELSWIADVVGFIIGIRGIVAVVFLPPFFTLVYRYIGHGKMRLRDHLPGAMFAALGWQVYSFGFAFYLRHFSNAGNIYGSMGAIIMFMIWVHSCITILFVGAEINVQLNIKELQIFGKRKPTVYL